MNTILIAPQVVGFVTAVREQLADLEHDEMLEITDGLEADLTDLVAEQGLSALGDPVAYAEELRQAAGLDVRISRPRRDVGAGVHLVLDACAERWRRVATALPFGAEDFLTASRPIWWLVRGYVAVQSALLWSGGWALTIVPDDSIDGGLIALVAIVLSIQLGRGKLWPGEGWSTNALLRVVLLALNVLAVVMVPVVANGFDHAKTDLFGNGYTRGYHDASSQGDGSDGPMAGIYQDGKWVSNIYPYDASGKPLVGVQLFDQVGNPLNVITQPEYSDGTDDSVLIDPETGQESPRIYYPWTNGATQVYNTFPLPSRIQVGEELSPNAFSEKVRPTIGQLPFANVPRVSLPGILVSVLKLR